MNGMPKASPINRAFNAGAWSPLVEGRVDVDRFPLSMRKMVNNYPTAQGPSLRRSGTAMQRPVFNETLKSYLLEFAFSNDAGQLYQIEAANLRFRFHDESGVLAYTPKAITVVDMTSATMKITVPGNDTVVGDQVVLAGFDFSKNLNGRVGNALAVVGNVVTTDIVRPADVGSLATATAARVYHIASPYLAADVGNIRFTADRSALYLFCKGYATRKLLRGGAYNWTLTTIDWVDGPYDIINEEATTLKASATGNAIPIMTSDVLPAGYVAAGGGTTNDYYLAFDNDPATYWESNTNQTGILQITLPAPVIVDGYTIEVAKLNNDPTYRSVDYAPGTWTFEGYDGANWIVLHSVVAYVVYDNLRSLYFKLKNATGYISYRINVTQCTRNGGINVRIGRLVMTSRASATTTVTASSTVGINNGQGFLATDVGRALRLQGKDGVWRWLKINGWTSPLIVAAEVKLDVLASIDATTEWRLGLFSDTTGWPISGGFYEDRLFVGGMSGYPDWLIGSVPGKYETIQQTDANGTVNDDNGIVVRLNARRLGQIVWIASDNRSLLIGTGSGEWAVSSADLQAALSAKTAKARRATVRGGATIEPVLVDRQVLFVQRTGRSLREMSYAFQIDGYQTPSLSLFASHLSVSGIAQIDFTFEPLAILWARTNDGRLLGFTYNREENVTGWHEHDLSGGFVESISALPSTDGKQDILWMTVKRTINGQTRRYIERFAPVWDFESTIDTAHFVDCAIRYQGVAATTLYGFWHLEGETIYGLNNGSPITPVVVANGAITLPIATTNFIGGLGYDSYGVTQRAEAGAGDGTAQGKEKRTNGVVMRLWQSGGGKVGTLKEDDTFDVNDAACLAKLQDLPWLTPETQLDTAPSLRTGDTKRINLEGGYNFGGSLVFMQPKELPLPLNVVAMMPQLHTMDR